MKLFLIATTIAVFSFGIFSGANIKTLSEMKMINEILAISVAQLSETEI